jgi:hypothetical protein
MLENANIKLSTVFSDVFGLTAWGMIRKLVAGETRMEELIHLFIHVVNHLKQISKRL